MNGENTVIYYSNLNPHKNPLYFDTVTKEMSNLSGGKQDDNYLWLWITPERTAPTIHCSTIQGTVTSDRIFQEAIFHAIRPESISITQA